MENVSIGEFPAYKIIMLIITIQKYLEKFKIKTTPAFSATAFCYYLANFDEGIQPDVQVFHLCSLPFVFYGSEQAELALPHCLETALDNRNLNLTVSGCYVGWLSAGNWSNDTE